MTDNDEFDQQETRNASSMLRNGIRILHAFSVDEPALGVTEISRRVDLHKSTVSRLLHQLEQMDLVLRDQESGRFRLGLGLIGIAGPPAGQSRRAPPGLPLPGAPLRTHR